MSTAFCRFWMLLKPSAFPSVQPTEQDESAGWRAWRRKTWPLQPHWSISCLISVTQKLL